MKRFGLAALSMLMAGAALAMPGFNINGGVTTASLTLSGTGKTSCVPILSVVNQNRASAPWLQPMIAVYLSSGASLTYSVEVTNDDVLAPGYSAASGNWVGFTGMTAQTASAAGTLGAAATCVRLNVTAYTSGTAYIQVSQQTTS